MKVLAEAVSKSDGVVPRELWVPIQPDFPMTDRPLPGKQKLVNNDRWSKDELAESHTRPGATTRASAAIVIASGRSIRDVCLPLFQVSGAKIVSVNKAVHYADFSDFVFTLDTVALEERLHLPLFSGERIAAVPQDHWLQATRRDGKVADRHPDIRYLDRVPFTKNDPQDKIMTGCSGFGAYQFAYKFLGARTIFLFGCDHDEQGTHFYGEEIYGAEIAARHKKNWDSALNYWNE